MHGKTPFCQLEHFTYLTFYGMSTFISGSGQKRHLAKKNQTRRGNEFILTGRPYFNIAMRPVISISLNGRYGGRGQKHNPLDILLDFLMVYSQLDTQYNNVTVASH